MSALLVGWLQGLLWLTAAVGAASVVFGMVAAARFQIWWDAPVGGDQAAYDSWLAMDEAWSVVGLLAALLTLVTAIVFMVWMHRAHRVSAWLNPRPRSWTSGWTVGGWFIPFANAVIPKLVLNEIERLAIDVRRGRHPDATWQKLPTMPIGWVWWMSWLASWLLASVSSGMLDSAVASSIPDPDQVRSVYFVGAVGDALWAFAAVCGLVYFRSLNTLLTPDC